jgi:hypothetical protein
MCGIMDASNFSSRRRRALFYCPYRKFSEIAAATFCLPYAEAKRSLPSFVTPASKRLLIARPTANLDRHSVLAGSQMGSRPDIRGIGFPWPLP